MAACCTFKQPWFMMQADDTNNVRTSNSNHHQTRNSIQYYFPLKRFDGLYNLSCSMTATRGSSLRPCPPSFSLKDDGISSYLASTDTDDEDHNNKHQKNCGVGGGYGYEAPLPSLPDYYYSAALVLVTCEYEAPVLPLPWLTEKGIRRDKNAFIIEGRRLLTCAHCIEHHTNVTITKQGSNTIYRATVIAISHDFDLAMLTVGDDGFWEGVGAVEFGDMPSLRDELTNMSYLRRTASITSRIGFISHMGMIPYSHGGLKLPGFEVRYDSKIAESGSAVFNVNGKCVGMAFHQDHETNNPGRVIPVTIIKHFIQDYDRNGRCTGLPIFGVKWQKMENHDLRMSMRMQHDQEGVLIRSIACLCPELLVLKRYDIILSIDGVKIANDGTVPFVQGQRIDFNYLFTQRYTGDNVLVKVLRNSNVRELSIKLATHKQFLPGDVKGRPQKYYIIGGLVFTTLTAPYIRSSYSWVQHEDCGSSLMDEALYHVLHEERIVVSRVLDAKVSTGYAMVDIINKQVWMFNLVQQKKESDE